MEKSAHDTANRSIQVSVILPAPVEQVWEAWSNPMHIAQWWGPTGFTNTIHKMDLQPGGEWRLTMHGPDGKNYPNRSEFIEIVPLNKIIFQHFNPHYLATVRLTPNDGETLLNWHMEFETADLFETVVKVFKADEGLQQNVEKLKTYLAEKM